MAEPRTALIEAVAGDIRAHVEKLRSGGVDFYGYALHPGELYDVHGLVSVTNSIADIKVPESDGLYRYYRYCVDEWSHWHREGFAATNAALVEVNKEFRSKHSKADDDGTVDEFEVAHANGLLEAILKGFEKAKAGGAFSADEPFLVVWAPNHEAMVESARRLNSSKVAEEFAREFGS